MGFMDRGYYRDRPSTPGGVAGWLLAGEVPLFNLFGISVRAHSSLIVFIVLSLLFGLGPGLTWQDRALSSTVVFLIVLMHEFGHCFAARWSGGSANDIVMHPLGGLALTMPPPRPWPHFITTLGGPMVNVIICLITGGIIFALTKRLPFLGLRFPFELWGSVWLDVVWYSFWVYQVSLALLLFNLLPIFPLDGGRMLQEVLWHFIGRHKSMVISTNVGIGGAVLLGIYALATGQTMLLVICVMGLLYCIQQKRAIQAGAFQMVDEADYSAAYDIHAGHPRMKSRKEIHRAAKKAKKLEEQEQAERAKIDAILAKVSAHGMHSLTWWEKRTLRKATEHQRQRDQELLRSRDG